MGWKLREVRRGPGRLFSQHAVRRGCGRFREAPAVGDRSLALRPAARLPARSRRQSRTWRMDPPPEPGHHQR